MEISETTQENLPLAYFTSLTHTPLHVFGRIPESHTVLITVCAANKALRV